MSAWRTIRVPASSANLGPGFDALGLALDLYLTCRFRSAEMLTIRAVGCDAELISTGEDNLIWRTAREVCGCTPVELEIHNAIPLGKGLGSSAAAVAAGIAIGSEVAGLGWDRSRILNEAAKMEGHPDNVAACVLGGIVTTAMRSCGTARAVRLDLHRNFGVAAVVPDFTLPTRESRSVLPDAYSRSDTIFNVQRASLLIAALASGVSDAFPAALEDRMHQPYRFSLVPGLEEIVNLRAPGLLGCALSGAGPSILVFFERGHEAVCERVREIFAAHGKSSVVLAAGVARDGYSIE